MDAMDTTDETDERRGARRVRMGEEMEDNKKRQESEER